MSQKILLVDDDANILQAFKRQLRKQYDVETAIGGKAGLEAVVQRGPFAVIVSDMQMPNMDGIQFLDTVRRMAPDSVRMMLTGNADQKTAMDAVNDGQIFRFLTKPCAIEDFMRALDAALEQHRLITAERELLSKTLSGSISVLTEVLSLVNPTAFGQTTRVRRLVHQLCEQIEADNAWEIEIAAMLSQVGCITIPEPTLARLSRGEPVAPEELESYHRHPQVGHDLIARIPRLRGVADIIANQLKHYDGSGPPSNGKQGDAIPLGARVLKLAIDVIQLMAAGRSADAVWETIHERTGWYDPTLVDALAEVLSVEYVTKEVDIRHLRDGMILDDHVLNKTGDVLIARGQEVTPSLRERLMTFAHTAGGVREPIRVRCPIRPATKSDDETAQEVASGTLG